MTLQLWKRVYWHKLMLPTALNKYTSVLFKAKFKSRKHDDSKAINDANSYLAWFQTKEEKTMQKGMKVGDSTINTISLQSFPKFSKKLLSNFLMAQCFVMSPDKVPFQLNNSSMPSKATPWITFSSIVAIQQRLVTILIASIWFYVSQWR